MWRWRVPRCELEELLHELGDEIVGRGLDPQEFVVVGGAAMLLRAFAVRPTRDVDVVAAWVPERGNMQAIAGIPSAVASAVAEVSRRSGGRVAVGPKWLNAGPASLMILGLPSGFQERLEVRRFGSHLVLHLPGREDIVALKVLAIVDGSRRSAVHRADLQSLGPTREELESAVAWIQSILPCPALHLPSFEVFRHDLRGLIIELGHEDLAYSF